MKLKDSNFVAMNLLAVAWQIQIFVKNKKRRIAQLAISPSTEKFKKAPLGNKKSLFDEKDYLVNSFTNGVPRFQTAKTVCTILCMTAQRATR